MDSIMNFAKSLLGVKYVLWKGESFYENIYPFYVKQIPSLEYIKKNGINCAGFINLLRQKSGLTIPGKEHKYKGGTDSWYKYFEENNKLKTFDYRENYPIGTLFGRKYRGINDQGHLAVLYEIDKDGLWLNNKIIHSYYEKKNKGKVGITTLGYSHYSKENGYYEYAVLPEDWLFEKK